MTEKERRIVSLTLLPHQAADNNVIHSHLLKMKELESIEIKSFKVIKRSIDARKKPVKVNLEIAVSSEDGSSPDVKTREYRKLSENAPSLIIVGAGPAGLFAGLKAIELGIKPIIIERGKDVDSRKQDIADISRKGVVDKDSNYCFGEGGAGTFSDGKLFTRSKKRGSVTDVLEILHQFGASEDILIESHPHIGSDRLPKIIKRIREKIRECGGVVRFNCRMDNLLISNGKVLGIITSTGEKIEGPVVLATGHSARDTIKMLKESGVGMEPKGLAIGVRLEHPQTLIDKMQYHSKEGRGKYLPAATYSFVNQAEGRGVYSFCMCPGGVIVPAVSDTGQIVVNGMSASARSGKWANSGYVVEIHPGDIRGFEQEGDLEMLALQEYLEKRFYDNRGGCLKAPAQKINDFLKGRISDELPQTSYAPGIYPSDFNQLFPLEISKRLKSGLEQIGKRCKEFISDQGIMIGLESRTSSPVRIPRDKETLHHVDIEGLYPVGEGAGYAGGIVSSAIDGMNCVEAFYKNAVNNG